MQKKKPMDMVKKEKEKDTSSLPIRKCEATTRVFCIVASQ